MTNMRSISDGIDPLDSSESLEAYAVLPAQFYGPRRRTADIEPIQRLMLAVLVDAVRCFRAEFDARQPTKRQEFAQARLWLFSDEEYQPFSFRAVCEALEIDAEEIRKGLMRWQEQKLSHGNARMIRRPALQSKPIAV
jgi:hypothetical protein